MAKVESASFAAAASPGGAVNAMASSGLRSVAVVSDSSENSLAICVPSVVMSFLFRLPWYCREIVLSFSTFAGVNSAESGCLEEPQREMRATVIHRYAITLIQRGRRPKRTQADRKAHAATSTQN